MHASLLWQQQTLPATGPRNFDSMDLDKQKKLASDARCASHSDPSFVHSMRKMRVFAPTASLCITHDQRIGQHVSICEHCQNLATMTKKKQTVNTCSHFLHRWMLQGIVRQMSNPPSLQNDRASGVPHSEDLSSIRRPSFHVYHSPKKENNTEPN